MTAPLRMHNQEGERYERPEAINNELTILAALSRDELLERCTIASTAHEYFVSSECLLHFVRASRQENNDAWFEQLYTLLLKRVLKQLPGRANGPQINLDIREAALDRFVELLASDKKGYDERLDIFESRFAMAVANLRRDANRQVFRRVSRSTEIHGDEDSVELAPEVEEAATDFDPFTRQRLDQADYQFALQAAIDSLPSLQRKIIHMLNLDYPIDSKDPATVTISSALNKSEKTIRTHRNAAYAALRNYLEPDAS